MEKKDVAIQKRAQISKASKTMFIWVAGSSVIVGFALVGILFLIQVIMYNERVLKVKDTTVATLKANNSNISELKQQVRVLDVNQNLTDSRAQPNDMAVQSILDALPSQANSLALGASLQKKLLAGVNDITIDKINVDPVFGVETTADNGFSNSSISSISSNQITFSFTVNGTSPALQEVLKNLERSIRTIDIVSFKLDGSSDKLSLLVSGRAYYEPARVVELKNVLVK